MELPEKLARLDSALRNMLIEDLPAQLREFETALDEKEFSAARAAVHSVHGTAAFCQLEELKIAAASLEDSLLKNITRKQDVQDFKEGVREVLRALEQTLGPMEQKK